MNDDFANCKINLFDGKNPPQFFTKNLHEPKVVNLVNLCICKTWDISQILLCFPLRNIHLSIGFDQKNIAKHVEEVIS